MVTSYSQGDEDEVLADLLPATGRFLDIGAHDGQTFSNTWALAERGWSGVCVEPAPALAARLLVTHVDHDVVVVSAAIVPGESGWATFWDTDTDCVGTLSTSHRDVWSDSTYTPLLVHTVTLASLLDEVGYDFDFVSIDTEGSSVDLLDELPVGQMPDLKVVCVETDRAAKPTGFRRAWMDGNNMIFVRKP